MDPTDALPEAEVPKRGRRNGRLVAVVGTVCALAIAGVLFAVSRHASDSTCSDLRDEISEIERETPIDAAQAWDDIYELQVAIQHRDELRAQLVAAGCG